MKNIHVTALGNALVDIELQVSEEELLATGLRKGGMTLASAEEQQQLLAMFTHKSGTLSSGGSAANTVIAVRQFGGRAAYKSLVGADAHGDFYSKEFTDLGLELFARNHGELPTGTCVVLITPDGERTMQTCLGANVEFNHEHVQEDSLKRAEWFYAEGYKFTDDAGTESIEKAMFYAKKHNTNIGVTFSDAFVVSVFRDSLSRAVKQADLIFCNEVEAKEFAQTDSIEEAYKKLVSDIPNFALTLGSNGSRIKIGHTERTIKPFAANVLNTNGAGDMYAGAFMYGLTHGLGVEKTGELASKASSKIVEQHGARLNSGHKEILIEVKGA